MKPELLAELKSLSNPALRSEEGGMVYEIWEDGEITLQKCGSLYGQRSVHMIVPPISKIQSPPDLLPNFNGKHSCMAVHVDNLVKARELICLLHDYPFENDWYRFVIPGYKE